MTATAVHAAGGSRASGASGARPARRRPLDLSTTPGRLRLLLVGLVLASLGWGALSAFTASQYSSAAASVVASREALSQDAQQIYTRLSDANDAAVTAFLAGVLESAPARQRYQADLAAAGTALADASARSGPGDGAAGTDLSALTVDLPVYAGEIETAQADNRIGLPLGAAYLREASGLMRDSLLKRAAGLYTAENANLSATSAEATGLPLVCVTGAAGLAVGFVLYRSARWLRGRTNRVLNTGLLVAGAALIASLAWLGVAYTGGRGDLLDAGSRGSATVEALAQVGIVAQQAHADESLTLIDDTGNDNYQTDFGQRQQELGPGPGTLLAAAQAASRGTPAAPAVAAVISDAQAWFAAHAQVRDKDNSGQHAAAVASVLATKAGTAGAAFKQLSADLVTATAKDQAVFDTRARSATSAYDGLEAGLIVAALIMAAGSAWGLTRRLAEYR